MMSKKTLVTLACACVLVGCRRDEQPEVEASSPQSYMNDKAFLKRLDDRRHQRDKLVEKRVALDVELQAEKAKNPDSERVKALQQQLDETDRAAERNRAEAYRIVRERLTKKDGGKK